MKCDMKFVLLNKKKTELNRIEIDFICNKKSYIYKSLLFVSFLSIIKALQERKKDW